MGRTEATVLILGERGTGKELVARALHAASPRYARPFVAINCAALSPELLAGELFGHERGAFTGATERRAGLLASAAHGTVFLDEVGDLPPSGQAMLLRFLQEREVRPIGATASHRVDVRVIAATNRSVGPWWAAQPGDPSRVPDAPFRPDLYDRLHEVTIHLLPLRERAEDIPLLVEHFLRLHARRHKLAPPRVSSEAAGLLARYAWPGNVRELEIAVSRAVIFCEGGVVRSRDLELTGAPGRVGAGAPVSVNGLTARQEQILRLVGFAGIVRRRDVTEALGISGESARRDLQALARRRVLRRLGRNSGSRYVPADQADE